MYDGECGGDGGAAALYESGDAVLSFPDHIALERVDDDAGAGAEEDVIQFYGDVAALDIAAAHDVAGASSAPAEQIEVAGMNLYGGGGDSGGGGGGDVLHQGGVPTGANDTGAGMPTSDEADAVMSQPEDAAGAEATEAAPAAMTAEAEAAAPEAVTMTADGGAAPFPADDDVIVVDDSDDDSVIDLTMD